MLEVSSNPAVQNGIKAAHAARAQAVNDAWRWLFGTSSSR